MNCAEVEKRLPDLLDDAFADNDETRRFEDHIAGCWRCREERDSILECQRLVAALPVLEPPSGFVTRVMAQVREEAHRPNLRHWLYGLLSLKSPIRVTAILLIGILSLYVYQKGDRDKAPTLSHLLDRSAPRTPETLPRSADNTSRRSESVENAAESTAANAPEVIRQRPEPSRSTKSVAENDQGQTIEPRRRIALPTQNVFSSRDGVQPASDIAEIAMPPPLPDMFPTEDLRSMPSAMRQALTGVAQRTADYEFVVRRRSLARRDAAANDSSASLRNSNENLEAASVTEKNEPEQSTGSFTANPVVEVRWYSVWPHHYQQFKNELASESVIQSETTRAKKENTSVAKSDRQLMIKVVILPSAQ